MRSLVFTLPLLRLAFSYCPPPGAILAPPSVTSSSPAFSIPDSVFSNQTWQSDTSFAIKASIGYTTVFEHEYIAPDYEVDQSLHETKFRIASVTKLFTVLAVVLSRDKIGWEDPITKYIPELNEEFYGEVRISALASQTSGLGRFGYVGDLAFFPTFIPSQFGIPQVNNTLPGCDPFPGGRVCTHQEVLDMFNNPAYRPYSPNSGPLYSNIAYNLLGMALEAVYSKSFEEIVDELIFTPVGMEKSTFETPNDDGSALLPHAGGEGWFVSDFANFNPTGGIWTTPDEMLIFLQSVLEHKLLPAAETRKWLQPHSFLPSLQQLVGAPWEIIRPTNLDVAFSRPIDIYTKAGGVTGYAGYGLLIPEYGIAITINAAGNSSGDAVQDLLPLIVEPLVAYADEQARSQANTKYAGTYTFNNGNSTNSITLSVDSGPGIAITSFTMGSVPVLRSLAALQGVALDNFSARLYPTDPDSIGTDKESWRILLDQVEQEKGFAELQCASWNWGDPFRYVKEPLDTVVFEFEGNTAISIELLGWRATLMRSD